MTPRQIVALAALEPAGRAAVWAPGPRRPVRGAVRSLGEGEPAEQFDVETYTMARLWIETGHAYLEFFRKNGRWPEGDPSIDRLVASFLSIWTSDQFAVTADEARQIAAWDDGSPERAGRLPPELRRGDFVFRDRDRLIATLNENNPRAAAQVKALAPDADEGDVEWWAIALASPFAGGLAVAGVLHSIGALSWRGVLLSQVSGYLLIASNVVAEVPIHTERGRQVAAAAWESIKQGAADAAGGIAWTAAIAAGGVLGAILLVVLLVAAFRAAGTARG